MTHAARNGKGPAREASSRIGREPRHAPRVKLAHVPLALKPASGARPEVDAVRRTVRIRISAQESIVLRPHLAPPDAYLRSRTRAIGEYRTAVRRATHVLSRNRYEGLRPARRRRNQESRNRPLGASVDIPRNLYRKRAAARAVTYILWRVKHGAVQAGLGAHDSKSLAASRIDHAQAEVDVRPRLHDLSFRNDDLTRSVARKLKMEQRLLLAVDARRDFVVRPVPHLTWQSEAYHLARPQRNPVAKRHFALRDDVESLARGKLRAIPFDARAVCAVEIRQDEQVAALPATQYGQRVATASRDDGKMRLATETRMRLQYEVQLCDKPDHVALCAPVEAALAVDVDLLGAVPLDAVRHSPCALPAKKRRELNS